MFFSAVKCVSGTLFPLPRNMVQIICKVWGIGILSIVALTTSNIYLTLRLLQSYDTKINVYSSQSHPICRFSFEKGSWTDMLQAANQTQYLVFLKESIISTGAGLLGMQNLELEEAQEERSMFDQGGFQIDPVLGRWDNKRTFKIFEHVYTGPNYGPMCENFPVCLATMASVDRLHWLIQVGRFWNSPISVAVFVPDVEYGIARAFLKYLTVCFPFVGEKISVHFAYHKNYPPKDTLVVIDNLQEKCNHPLLVLKDLLKLRDKTVLQWREKMAFPQNMLRNVARKGCSNQWVFLTDVDIIPIQGLSESLTKFLYSSVAISCKLCAFVIPTYEVDEGAIIPQDKATLLQLRKKGKVQPFHEKVFIHNQHATNFSRWESIDDFLVDGDSQVFVSHNVTNFEFFYEPFYVARDDVPAHDERFVGYGFTRNTQVYEMFVAGYTFHVLSPIFTVHLGLQIKKTRPSWRETQNSLNRKRFEGFKKEVFVRYQRDPLKMMVPKSQKKVKKF